MTELAVQITNLSKTYQVRTGIFKGEKTDWNRKVDEIMEIVGLPSRLKYSYPNQLSSEQRQRVVVAKADDKCKTIIPKPITTGDRMVECH